MSATAKTQFLTPNLTGIFGMYWIKPIRQRVPIICLFLREVPAVALEFPQQRVNKGTNFPEFITWIVIGVAIWKYVLFAEIRFDSLLMESRMTQNWHRKKSSGISLNGISWTLEWLPSLFGWEDSLALWTHNYAVFWKKSTAKEIETKHGVATKTWSH